MRPYYVLGTALVAKEASKNKTDKTLCLGGAYNLAGGTHNKDNIRERKMLREKKTAG